MEAINTKAFPSHSLFESQITPGESRDSKTKQIALAFFKGVFPPLAFAFLCSDEKKIQRLRKDIRDLTREIDALCFEIELTKELVLNKQELRNTFDRSSPFHQSRDEKFSRISKTRIAFISFLT